MHTRKSRAHPLSPPVRLLLAAALVQGCAHGVPPGPERGGGEPPLTVVAIGDAGEANAALRANAALLAAMHSGRHDGGPVDALIFLGDNFYETGLNVPADDVGGTVRRILGPFRVPMEDLGRSRVHAVPGNHEYYARHAIEASVLFGLVKIAEGPIGLAERGNARAREIGWWTYHDRFPGETTLPLSAGSPDSVQFIFVDSALPLRTPDRTWEEPLDSLQRLLRAGAARRGLLWRVLCMHHPFYTVGEHGGFSVWDDERSEVGYVPRCDRDSDAVSWARNFIDPEDPCAEKYVRYAARVKGAIREAGVPVQILLAGHDHSMQLLYYPDRDADCSGCPKVHVLSGAGSRPTRVMFPRPPSEYTSAQRAPAARGISVSGFAQLRFGRDALRLVFYDGRSQEPVDMGEGRREFLISRDGRLMEGAPPEGRTP
ncbi:MAG: metallophosphoesterase [Bacteroidota bacterium]